MTERGHVECGGRCDARLRWPPVTHTPLTGLRVTHFGHFDPAYSRNRIVAKALRPRRGRSARGVRSEALARRTAALVRRAFARVDRSRARRVPRPRRRRGRESGRAARGAPVLFDAFVSLQETAEDRGGAVAGSGRRRLDLEDRLACRLADRVLVDTEAHGRALRDRARPPGPSSAGCGSVPTTT